MLGRVLVVLVALVTPQAGETRNVTRAAADEQPHIANGTDEQRVANTGNGTVPEGASAPSVQAPEDKVFLPKPYLTRERHAIDCDTCMDVCTETECVHHVRVMIKRGVRHNQGNCFCAEPGEHTTSNGNLVAFDGRIDARARGYDPQRRSRADDKGERRLLDETDISIDDDFESSVEEEFYVTAQEAR